MDKKEAEREVDALASLIEAHGLHVKRFQSLRLMAFIYKILAFLAAVGAAAGFFFGVSVMFSESQTGMLIAAKAIMYGGVSVVTLFAAGEAIYVFLSIEDNIRVMTELMKRNHKATDKKI